MGISDPHAAATGATVAHPRRRGLAIVAAILSAACWGSATVMSKGVLAHMPPLTLVTIQLTASIAVLWLAVFVLGRRVRLDRPTRRASLSGLFEPGLSYTFGIVGLALTTASNAALIGAVEPLFILFLAWLLLKERIGPQMLGLALLATIGIVLVIAPDMTVLSRRGSLAGDLLLVAGTFFAAFYVIATRRLVLTLDPLPLSALQQSVGLVWTLGVLLTALVVGLAHVGLAGVPAWALLMAAGSGIIQYALAFWLYLFALQSLPANVAGLYLTLIPVFGIAAAVIFLGEGLAPVQWLGALCIVMAVAAISRLTQD